METPESRPAVLVADDNDGVALVLEDLLTELGLETRRATNGPDALRMAAEPGLRLAILDVMLPGLDGYGVLVRLRGEPWGRDLPVVVVTGEDGPVHDEVAEALGAAGVVRKPFDVSLLSARLRELVAPAAGVGA